LLGIIEGQPEVEQLLIPPLMNLGLTSLLINLLSFEMSKLTKERIPERYGRTETHLKDHQVLVNGISILAKKNKCYALLCSMYNEPLCMFSGTPSLKLFSELLKPFLLQIAILKRFALAKNFFN